MRFLRFSLPAIVAHRARGTIKLAIQSHRLKDRSFPAEIRVKSTLELPAQFWKCFTHILRPNPPILELAVWQQPDVFQDNSHYVALYLDLYSSSDTPSGKC